MIRLCGEREERKIADKQWGCFLFFPFRPFPSVMVGFEGVRVGKDVSD